MKVLLILVFVIGLFPIQVCVAQSCVNEVSTNPRNTPTQSHLDALPRDPGNSSTHDERFINGWQWWMEPLNPDVEYNIPIRDMRMSPSEVYDDFMEPINSNLYSGVEHYQYLSESIGGLMLPENGWEILSQNRGWYPDDITEVDWSQNSGVRAVPRSCEIT